MIGAILVAGSIAFVSSLLATLTNFTVSRKFPGIAYSTDPEIPEAMLLRISCYRLAAKLFYRQALCLWSLFGVLVIIKVLPLITSCPELSERQGMLGNLVQLYAAMCNGN